MRVVTWYLEKRHRPTDGRLDHCCCGGSWPCRTRRLLEPWRWTQYEGGWILWPRLCRWIMDRLNRPYVGLVVCDCRYKHLPIVQVVKDPPGDYIVTLMGGFTCSWTHCIDPGDHQWTHEELDGLSNDE